jgi:hypothetical protein
MNAVRNVVSVTLTLIVTGILLGSNFSIQRGPCYAGGLLAGGCYTGGHAEQTEKSLLNKCDRCHDDNKHEYGTSFNTAPLREGVAQLIDLEDEGAVTFDHNRLEGKISSSGTCSTCHCIKVAYSSLPIYLLKSSFRL